MSFSMTLEIWGEKLRENSSFRNGTQGQPKSKEHKGTGTLTRGMSSIPLRSPILNIFSADFS